MSNQEKDHPQVDIIESEIIETPTVDSIEPVVVKKGSFLTFVAFILSASALTVSAYLYILQNNNSTDNKNLASHVSVADLEKKTNQKFTQLSKQIDQLKKTNGLLQNQLKTIEEIAAKIQPNSNSNPLEKATYDDTQMVQHIKALETQLAIQNKSLKQTQLNVSNSNTQQKQSMQRLEKQINKALNSPSSITTTSSLTKINHTDEIIESLLQAAHIQLNVHGNVNKAQDLLNKAQNHLKQSIEPQYINMAAQLKITINEIMKSPPLDISKLNNTIDELSVATLALLFNQDNVTKKQTDDSQSSWYDKLIVIRKIDDSKQARQTQDQQQDTLFNIKNYYEMMKIALMGNNQELWNNEISAIQGLLNQHFSDNSSAIQTQLIELKSIDINPVFPDLGEYLETFKGFNNNDITDLNTDVDSDSSENN